MPKYYPYTVCGYYLYYTSSCTVEAFHVHASDKKLTEASSAKFWVGSDGSVKVAKRGRLSDVSITHISKFISDNYMDMYEIWRMRSQNGFYNDTK